MSLAEKVRQFRTLKGMSQRALAEAAKTTGGNISQIETGKNPNPNIAVVRAIATALGTTTAALMEEEPGDDLRRLCPLLALRPKSTDSPTCIAALCEMWVRIEAPRREPFSGCAVPLLVFALLQTNKPDATNSLTGSEREELEQLRESSKRINAMLSGARSA